MWSIRPTQKWERGREKEKEGKEEKEEEKKEKEEKEEKESFCIIFIPKDSMNNIYIGVPSFSKQSQHLFLTAADQAMHVCQLIPLNFSHRGQGIGFPPSS